MSTFTWNISNALRESFYKYCQYFDFLQTCAMFPFRIM